MRMTGSDEAGVAIENPTHVSITCFVASRYGSCGLLRPDHKQISARLWQQGCLEVASRLHHVGVVDESVGLIDITVGNATRLGASQRSATRRSASQHIATQRLSRWGSPAARARLARTVPLNRLWLRDAYRSQPEAETEEV